jgi:hypothetical protein
VDGLREKLREFFRQEVRAELRAVAALNNVELTDENDSDEILTDHRLRFCQRQQVANSTLHNVFTICLLQD